MDDRHARHRRRTADPRRRPIDGYRAGGTDRFDRLVGDALRAVPPTLLEHLQQVEIRIADLPPVPPMGTQGEVALSRYESPAGGPSPRGARRQRGDLLTLFRRPLEARARNRAELLALVREVVVHEVAHHLGIDDDGIEERGWN